MRESATEPLLKFNADSESKITLTRYAPQLSRVMAQINAKMLGENKEEWISWFKRRLAVEVIVPFLHDKNLSYTDCIASSEIAANDQSLRLLPETFRRMLKDNLPNGYTKDQLVKDFEQLTFDLEQIIQDSELKFNVQMQIIGKNNLKLLGLLGASGAVGGYLSYLFYYETSSGIAPVYDLMDPASFQTAMSWGTVGINVINNIMITVIAAVTLQAALVSLMEIPWFFISNERKQKIKQSLSERLSALDTYFRYCSTSYDKIESSGIITPIARIALIFAGVVLSRLTLFGFFELITKPAPGDPAQLFFEYVVQQLLVYMTYTPATYSVPPALFKIIFDRNKLNLVGEQREYVESVHFALTAGLFLPKELILTLANETKDEAQARKSGLPFFYQTTFFKAFVFLSSFLTVSVGFATYFLNTFSAVLLSSIETEPSPNKSYAWAIAGPTLPAYLLFIGLISFGMMTFLSQPPKIFSLFRSPQSNPIAFTFLMATVIAFAAGSAFSPGTIIAAGQNTERNANELINANLGDYQFLRDAAIFFTKLAVVVSGYANAEISLPTFFVILTTIIVAFELLLKIPLLQNNLPAWLTAEARESVLDMSARTTHRDELNRIISAASQNNNPKTELIGYNRFRGKNGAPQYDLHPGRSGGPPVPINGGYSPV